MILMQQSFNQIQWLFPTSIDWEQWKEQRAVEPFAPETIVYLNALSASILKDPLARAYPDVITFAFFCRKANINQLAERYTSEEIRLGRGLAFHIAPSNVPINFGYSLVAGLLAGNYNVVRVSSKPFQQVDIVLKHMKVIAPEYSEVSRRIAIVRYEHESNANDIFSAACHTRIIWGGDATIAKVRQSPISARSYDICFADRYSLAAINADELVKEQDMSQLAERFYNDTYLFDQNACSAPHLIIWTGAHVREAKERFWDVVQQYVDAHYQLQDVLAVDKLTAFYRQSVAMDMKEIPTESNILKRVELKILPNEIDDYRCAGGYFSEYTAQSLDEIAPIVKNRYQTLAYYGYSKEDLQSFVTRNKLVGIDRIVPIGNTTVFSLIWDGYDLIKQMSRIININGMEFLSLDFC